jgi:hypothetical protein
MITRDERPTLTKRVITRDVWVACNDDEDGAVKRLVDDADNQCCMHREWHRLVGTNCHKRYDLTEGATTAVYRGDGVTVFWEGAAWSEGVCNTMPLSQHYPGASIVELFHCGNVVARIVE